MVEIKLKLDQSALRKVVQREMTTIGKVEIQLKLDQSALRKVIKQEMTKIGKELQSAADDLWRRNAGRPLPTVRAAMKRHPTFRGGPLDDNDLNAMAEAIASGARIQFRVR
jgi:hypothetical protein